MKPKSKEEKGAADNPNGYLCPYNARVCTSLCLAYRGLVDDCPQCFRMAREAAGNGNNWFSMG